MNWFACYLAISCCNKFSIFFVIIREPVQNVRCHRFGEPCIQGICNKFKNVWKTSIYIILFYYITALCIRRLWNEIKWYTWCLHISLTKIILKSGRFHLKINFNRFNTWIKYGKYTEASFFKVFTVNKQLYIKVICLHVKQSRINYHIILQIFWYSTQNITYKYGKIIVNRL